MALNNIIQSPLSTVAYKPVQQPIQNAENPALGFNTGTFALSAGVNTYNAIANAILQNSYYKMQANAAETEGILAQAAFASSNRYNNIELGNNIIDINNYYNKFKGTQIASIAMSNFDESVGDKRLIADTERNKERAIYDANTQAFYTAWEANKQANINTINARAQAKIARQQAKYATGWGMFSNILTGIMSAAAGSVTSVKPEIASAKVG